MGKVSSTHGTIEKVIEFLFTKNPAPYQGIFKINNHTIVSSSPERLFSCDNGNVITSPIKGTIARDNNDLNDKANKQKLLQSKKDLAELAMIVDLLRNDLYKVAGNDSVTVKKNADLLTYTNVYHLCAHIVAKVDKQKVNAFDILQSLFPGGSISGCPKIKACQIIDKLEKNSRGPYTGSLGYFSFNNKAQFNILIRTIHFYRYYYCYRLGSGITWMSDADEEYRETVVKGKTILAALQQF